MSNLSPMLLLIFKKHFNDWDFDIKKNNRDFKRASFKKEKTSVKEYFIVLSIILADKKQYDFNFYNISEKIK